MFWYELALSLENPFDFEEFKLRAESEKIQYGFDRYLYCCWVGQLMGQRVLTGDVITQELYRKALNQVVTDKPIVFTPTSTDARIKSSCCGGGSVV